MSFQACAGDLAAEAALLSASCRIPAELEIARACASVRLHTSPKPSATRAGWPRTTTKISMWSPGCCRAACTSISTISTPIAAGPMIWATKFPIPRKALELLDDWDQELRDCYAGSLRIPSSSRCDETIDALRHSHRAVFRSAHCVSPGPDRAALCHLGRRASITAAIRRIRWAAWCCICAATATPSASGFPMPPARRCSSRISGRT